MKKRNICLDLVRIIATILVIMIHSSSFFVKTYRRNTYEFIIGNILDSLSHIAVPLFIMISGALLLDETNEIRLSYILNKIKNVIKLICIWSLIYVAIYEFMFPLLKGEEINIKRIIYSLINGHYHMWYLYMVIGLYLITPFLRTICKKGNKSLILGYIIIAMVIYFLRQIANILEFNMNGLKYLNEFLDKFYLGFFENYIPYYLLGWYIVNFDFKKKDRIKVLLLGIGSMLTIICYSILTLDYETAWMQFGILIFLASASVFLAINNLDLSKIMKLRSKIILVSNLTFGVYIIHPIFIDIFQMIYRYEKIPFLYIMLCCTCVTLISFLVVYMISKLPKLKIIVRM